MESEAYKPKEARSMSISDFLLEEINRTGWKKNAFADQIKISRSTLYNILSGSTPISRENAQKLSDELGHSHDFWMRSQVLVEEDTNIVPFLADATLGTAHANLSNFAELLTDNMLRDAVRDSQVGISGYDDEYQRSASYDLTLHNELTVLSPDGRRQIDLNGTDFTLKHMESVAIQTKEEVSLSNHYIARVGATAEMAKAGLLVNTGLQIDPGFSGRLQASILNFSGRSHRLFIGQVVMSIEVYHLPVAPRKGYTPLQSSSSLFLCIKGKIQDKLVVRKLDDQVKIVSWESAGVEVKASGTGEEAVRRALDVIARKLGAPEVSDALSVQIQHLFSDLTPSKSEFAVALGQQEMNSYSEHAESDVFTPVTIPDFEEGEETLRGILDQTNVSICQFGRAALLHARSVELQSN